MPEDKIDVEIYKRKFTIELEGLTPLEAQAVAALVENRMREISKETGIVDSSKLAIKAALEFAAELQKLSAELHDTERLDDTQLDDMIVTLENSLAEKP